MSSLRLLYNVVDQHGNLIDQCPDIDSAREVMHEFPMSHIDYIGCRGTTMDEINAYQHLEREVMAVVGNHQRVES